MYKQVSVSQKVSSDVMAEGEMKGIPTPDGHTVDEGDVPSKSASHEMRAMKLVTNFPPMPETTFKNRSQ